jgi:hypothetical protein
VKRARKQAYLIILSVIVLCLAIFVLVRHKSLDTDALAGIAIAGGFAIIIVSLPDNGNDK